MFLNEFTSKFGDVIRYSKGAENTVTHGSMLLLSKKQGNKIFTKNGTSNKNVYRVMYQTEMLKASKTTDNPKGYGDARGMTNPGKDLQGNPLPEDYQFYKRKRIPFL